ncbi:MAG TPA: YbaK/EbsC family protein [Nocardioidaceae bacterium]|nr:YbaK/EbsC family protein [Nocardioidaceae bacterium]
MNLGTLELTAAGERPDLLAPAVADAIAQLPNAQVAPIDPDLADTAALCAAYDVPLGISANCVVVTGKRAGVERHAACVVLATTRADVNGIVRRRLDARKASFAATDFATEATGMEYGGITPLGLPADWLVLVDAAVADTDIVVIGSGLRRSKIVLPGAELAKLPGAEVIDGLGR